MNIPTILADDITHGRVVLFLGAGASVGAKNPDGNSAPIGRQLGDLISDRFLGGKFKDRPLTTISELAISEADFVTFQDYVASVFKDLSPTDFHLLIPSFKWRGIFTTNYDELIEKTYTIKEGTRLQKPAIVRSNNDRLDELSREINTIPLVKLHGCITVTHDVKLPLILTTDQYIEHNKNRDRLFRLLYEWGNEYTIVFIGHALQDYDIRSVLAELNKLESSRPRYYTVSTSISPEEERLLDAKRITTLQGTFSDFLNSIKVAIPENKRILLSKVTGQQSMGHPILSKTISGKPLDAFIQNFLDNDVEYVHASMPISTYAPSNFYRGFDLGWFSIEKKLDVRRELTDQILYEFLLKNESERSTTVDFAVIRAEAGSGKSVLLRRLAWEAAVEGGLLCLYLREGGKLNYNAITELFRLTKERIYIFIDSVGAHILEIEELIRRAREEKVEVTILGAERTNEWNMKCEQLSPYLTSQYELKYLSKIEIETLIKLLKKYNSLGYLAKLDEDEQVEKFFTAAGRQILVALHEATSGKPFEEIVFDEYRNIKPEIARSIYLTICTLNQFGVPVRAGLISRLYGIPFPEFKKQLFNPLEHVVYTEESHQYGDYVYMARHSEIASMVSACVFTTPALRFSQYSKILNELNISFSSDYQSYRKLIHGRSLLDAFPDHTEVVEIYKMAKNISPDDPYLHHQQGIYEMHRPNGNLEQSHRFLLEARRLDEGDLTVQHSLAELCKKRAGNASTILEKERFRKEAEEISLVLLGNRSARKYARHTLLKIYLERLEEAMKSDSASSRELNEEVKTIENYIETGLQESPNDSHLLVIEANLRTLVSGSEKAIKVLEKAHSVNKRDTFIATRLSKSYVVYKDIPKAIQTLEATLSANPNDKHIHYQLAILYKEHKKAPNETIIHHLRRGFTPGDHNYDAQFWYAYYCFISDDKEEMQSANKTFLSLRASYLPYDVKVKTRAYAESDGVRKIYEGEIIRLEASHGFVRRKGIGDDIFLHKNDVDEETWRRLSTGQRAKFCLGFNLNGPTVCDIKII